MQYILYILECSDGSLYTGITNSLENRLETHKAGKGSKYVRSRLPFVLRYTEVFGSRSEALKREIEVKRMGAEGKRGLCGGVVLGGEG
jgi:putative endonuclease